MRALREERYIVSYLGFRSPTTILQTLLHIGHTPFVYIYCLFIFTTRYKNDLFAIAFVRICYSSV